MYDGGLVAFETTQAGVLPAGELSVDLPAQAVEPGPGGNVSAGTVRTMAVAPVGVAACTNPVPFTGGREEEEDEELRARILATYQQLPNGTNGAYYAQEALAVEGVTAVRVLPKNRGMGTVDVIIAGWRACQGKSSSGRSRSGWSRSGRSRWTWRFWRRNRWQYGSFSLLNQSPDCCLGR